LGLVVYRRSPHFDGADSLYLRVGQPSEVANASQLDASIHGTFTELSARAAAAELQRFGGFRPIVSSLEVTVDRHPETASPIPLALWPDMGPTTGGSPVILTGHGFEAFANSKASLMDCPVQSTVTNDVALASNLNAALSFENNILST